jgi:hypothetical protein
MRTLSRRCLIPINDASCFCYFNAYIIKGTFASPNPIVLGIRYAPDKGFTVYYGINQVNIGDFRIYPEGTFSFDSRYLSNELLASFDFVLQCIGVSLGNIDLCTFEC